MKQLVLAACIFWFDEEGVTAIEYALLASLIAVAIFASVALLGLEVGNLYARISICVVNLACP